MMEAKRIVSGYFSQRTENNLFLFLAFGGISWECLQSSLFLKVIFSDILGQ